MAAYSYNNASSMAASTKGVEREDKNWTRRRELFFSLSMCVGGTDHYGVFLTSEPSCKGELTSSFSALGTKKQCGDEMNSSVLPPPPSTTLIFLPMDLNHRQKQEGNIAEESYGPIISHWLSSGLKSGHTQDTLLWPRNVGWLKSIASTSHISDWIGIN